MKPPTPAELAACMKRIREHPETDEQRKARFVQATLDDIDSLFPPIPLKASSRKAVT